LFLASLLFSLPAAAQVDVTSSTFQIDAAHDGLVRFSKPFSPPLKMRWSVNLGGPISYPVVNGGLVTVLTTGPVGTLLVTLNAVNGKVVWRKIVEGDNTGDYLAADDGKIFLTTFGGPFQAFDAPSGRLLWSNQLPGEAFFNYVPVVAGGRLFAGGDFSGTEIYQLDETIGVVRWQHELAAGGIGPTAGDNKVFMPIPCAVVAYVPATGKQVWNFSTGCDGGGGAIASYYRQRLYAPDVDVLSGNPGVILDTNSGKRIGSFGGAAPAFYGSASYTISGTSLASNDITTGKLRWSYKPKTDTISLPPILINGNTYTLSDQGTLSVNAAGNGRLLQSFRIGIGGATQPSQAPSTGLGVGSNLLFVPSGNILAAFSP
jgi:outer membrane protein assembly factor BamB